MPNKKKKERTAPGYKESTPKSRALKALFGPPSTDPFYTEGKNVGGKKSWVYKIKKAVGYKRGGQLNQFD